MVYYSCLQSGEGYVFSQVCLPFSPGVFYVTITHDALNLTTRHLPDMGAEDLRPASWPWNLKNSQPCPH